MNLHQRVLIHIVLHSESRFAYVHAQNGLAESLIKHIQIIARTLLLRTNLNDTAWGHAVLHAATLIRLRPTASLIQSPLQMVLGYEPDISNGSPTPFGHLCWV